MKTELKKLENAQVEIKVTLPAANVEKHRDVVTKEALTNVEVDGFRKGHVPADIAMKQLSPLRLFEEMAQRAISDSYVSVLEETKVQAIGHPQIMITKIAEGSDLEFTLTTAVMPEVTLGDYKKAAKTAMATELDLVVTEDEVASAVDNVRKMRAQQKMAEDQKGDEEPTSWSDIKEEDLPEVTDEFVKEIGKFENVADFNTKIKENLTAEKEAKALEKRRLELIETILADATIEVPDMMVDYEVDKMMHEFEHNISMSGMAFDQYLESIGKTREDYKTEWRDQGVKRSQTQLMLNKIAAEENIDPTKEEVEAEVAKIMEQYKNQTGIDENNVKAYVASVLTHQKVFEFLEAQK